MTIKKIYTILQINIEMAKNQYIMYVCTYNLKNNFLLTNNISTYVLLLHVCEKNI